MTEEQVKVLIGNIVYEEIMSKGIGRIDEIAEILFTELDSKGIIS
jgi:hypothetical protein